MIFLAKSLYVGNFFKNVREKYNISSVVQSESQFIPCAISFQYFLDNNYKIYSRHGGGKKTSVRVYCDKSEAYTIRAEASKKTFEYQGGKLDFIQMEIIIYVHTLNE